MSLDLSRSASAGKPWRDDPVGYWRARAEAVADLSGPVVTVDVDALADNAADLVDRSAGVPIRVASKSIRVRAVLDAVLDRGGYRGVLAYTLPEAQWLAETHDDVVVGYPTADRAALAALVADEAAAARVVLMVDDPAQLDLIDAVAAPHRRAGVRVALDVDASWRHPILGHVGVRRSPVHTAAQARRLAEHIVRRRGFNLVGLMMYEAQIAGQPDAAGPDAPVIRWMQRRSRRELADRRGEVVAAVRAVAPLAFVNGGGTGSLESTASDPAVTETTAGSGLFAGHLFDGYRAFRPAPAAAFALEVVRKPASDIVTVLGGGWIASGPPLASRQPRPVWPEGLRMLGREGAGEVQTPLRGAAARSLAVGDRVWFRHAKSGELSEHVERIALTSGRTLLGTVPTYRGDGRSFL